MTVGIFATVGPFLIIIIIEILNGKQTSQKSKSTIIFNTINSLSLFLLGISLTLCLTEICKRWIGRLRPHFIAVCQPDLSQLNCTTETLTGVYFNAIYTGDTFCTNTNTAAVKEARFSFPSGHSSYSSYCMMFLIIYIENRLLLLRFRYLKPLIQTTAFIAALVTCLSRVSDNQHRASDVWAGAILGIIF